MCVKSFFEGCFTLRRGRFTLAVSEGVNGIEVPGFLALALDNALIDEFFQVVANGVCSRVKELLKEEKDMTG